MSPSVYLLLFIFYKFPLCIFLLTFSPAFFPPRSLYQVLYNVGSPDVLPASIRHFDSVQLSMIMYFSLNHSFPPLSCLPSPRNTHAQAHKFAIAPVTRSCHGNDKFLCEMIRRGPMRWQNAIWDAHMLQTHTEKSIRCVFDRQGVGTFAAGPSRRSHQISYSLTLSRSILPPHRPLYSLE